MAATPGQKEEKRPRHVMWQDRWRPCAVFTETSEGFAPYYLAGIRHDIRQTTQDPVNSPHMYRKRWRGLPKRLFFQRPQLNQQILGGVCNRPLVVTRAHLPPPRRRPVVPEA